MGQPFYLDPEPAPSNGAFYIDPPTEVTPAESAGRAFTGGMQNILNGLTLGFGDEGVAGANALIDRAQGVPLGAAYDQRLADTRAMRSEFRQAAGGPLAIASDVGSSLLIPIKKEMLLARPKTAAAILGGLYGLGESEGGIENRAFGAAGGAVAGAGTTGLIQVLGAGAKAALQSELGLKVRDAASKAKEYLSKTLLSPELGQAGKVTVTGGDAVPALAPDLSPTQVQLLQRAREVSPAQMAKAASTLDAAISEQVPMTLVEALGNQGTTRQARFLANYEPTMGKVGDFLETRQASAPSRIEEALQSTVGGETSPYKGGELLRKGAQEIDAGMRQETNKVAKVAFAEADAAVPEYWSDDVIRLIEHPDVKPSIEKARRAVAVDRGVDVAKVTENDAEVVRRTLSDLTTRARNKFDQHNLESGYAQQLKKALENATEAENPSLKTARDAYSIMMQMKKDAGSDAITLLKNIEDGRLEGAGKVLMQMPDKEIATLRATFAKMGKLDEFKAGVRAYFQNILDSNTGSFSRNTDVVEKMIGDTRIVKRVEAALGVEDASKLFDKLARERKMYRGMQELNAKSGTAGNLAETNAFEAQPGKIGTVLRAILSAKTTTNKAIDKFLMRPANEQLAQDMAETYITNPRQGLSDLRAILPIQEQRFPYINQTNELVKALIRGGGRSAATISGQLGSTK